MLVSIMTQAKVHLGRLDLKVEVGLSGKGITLIDNVSALIKLSQ